MTNPNEQAFPAWMQDSYGSNFKSMGLTKREWFSGIAMHAMLNTRKWSPVHEGKMEEAVKMADALITELDKENT